MKKLKVLIIGTKEDLLKANDLKDDCHRLQYKVQTIELGKQKNISHQQFAKVNAIVEYMNYDWHTETLCLIDPGCRILEAVPQEWIDSGKPVVFKNHDNIGTYKFEGLPKLYTDKIFIFSNLDLWWITWWRDSLRSMKQDDLYPPSESMFAFALHFNSVDKLIETDDVVFKCQQ
mgnify:CR=1 FL=1